MDQTQRDTFFAESDRLIARAMACLEATGALIRDPERKNRGYLISRLQREWPSQIAAGVRLGAYVDQARNERTSESAIHDMLVEFYEYHLKRLGIPWVEERSGRSDTGRDYPGLLLTTSDIAKWERAAYPSPATTPLRSALPESAPTCGHHASLKRVYDAAIRRQNAQPQEFTVTAQRNRLLEELRGLLFEWSER